MLIHLAKGILVQKNSQACVYVNKTVLILRLLFKFPSMRQCSISQLHMILLVMLKLLSFWCYTHLCLYDSMKMGKIDPGSTGSS